MLNTHSIYVFIISIVNDSKSMSFLTYSSSLSNHLQIDADDVITRDEQIYVLIGAHAKCERNIQAQMALIKGLCAATDHSVHF